MTVKGNGDDHREKGGNEQETTFMFDRPSGQDHAADEHPSHEERHNTDETILTDDSPTEPVSNTSLSAKQQQHTRRVPSMRPGAIRVYPPGTTIHEVDDDIVETMTGVSNSRVQPVRVVDVTNEVLIGVAVDDSESSDPVAAELLKGRYVKRRRLILLIMGVVLGLCVIGVIIGVTTRPDSDGNLPPKLIDLPQALEKLAMGLPNYTVAVLQNELPAPRRTDHWYKDAAWFDNSTIVHSPQGKAWKWLMSLPSLNEQILVKEKFALATFYFATDGDNWKNNSKWLSRTDHICDWWSQPKDPRSQQPFLAHCKGTLGFQQLVMPDNGLKGSVPPEIGFLTRLTLVNLAGNALQGDIHEDVWESWRDLSNLSLLNNNFTGSLSTMLGLFSNLRVLNLDTNQFTGTLPTELGLLSTYLKEVFLTNNLLAGSVPSEYGHLGQLTYLVLDSNGFIGPIPSSIGGMQSLLFLRLASNKLSGSIPSETGLCRMLQLVDLSHNPHMTGTIPTQVAQLSQLAFWYLYNSSVTGMLPTQLSNLESLRSLDVSGTRMSGTVPSGFGQMSRLASLRINNTDMSGSIPSTVCQSFAANRASNGIVVDCDQVACDCNCTCAADLGGTQ